MSQETRTETTAESTMGLADWQAGVVGGLVGGAVMGAILSAMNPAVIAGAIAALYGLAPPPNGIAGWIAHMAHSAIFGVVFAAILSTGALSKYADRTGASAVLGLVWGFVLWVLGANVVMAVWLDTVGFPGGPALLGFALPGSLVPHLVYGVILGALFSFLGRR